MTRNTWCTCVSPDRGGGNNDILLVGMDKDILIGGKREKKDLGV